MKLNMDRQNKFVYKQQTSSKDIELNQNYKDSAPVFIISGDSETHENWLFFNYI